MRTVRYTPLDHARNEWNKNSTNNRIYRIQNRKEHNNMGSNGIPEMV
jgi:hypothetical protein